MSTTATHPPRLYRLDFHGRHNIATGMINTALTAVSAAVVAHVVTATGAATILQAALTMAAVTILGVIMTLMWGVFSRKAPSGGVIAHRIACWVGAGTWSAMLSFRDWDMSTLLQYGTILAVATATVGFVGWMGTPVTDSADVDREDLRAEELRQQLIRDDLAEEWKDRIRRVTRIEHVEIPGIQDYGHKTPDGRRVGYTLEVHLPAGGASWRTLERAAAELANDLNLAPGCDIAARMGSTRRVALVDVTVVNILDEEQLYPTDYSPMSILDPLPMMTNRRGATCGPVIREQNMGIFGESGSGKTNTGQVIGAGIARMVDAHLCDIDVTGIRLSMPLIRPFLEGRAKHPAVWWVAYDLPEAILMLRALNRAALARNNGYNDLILSVGDDKMPISAEFPAFIVRCDEIKHIASVIADPVAFSLIKRITDDHRYAGFRAVMLGLRGTNEIIAQSIQAQLHNLGVLKAQSKSEYVAVFGGQAHNLDPADAPYSGCIQMRLDSSGHVQPYHVWRLVGKQLDDIGVAVSDYQPGVDALTWLALNGRDQNGLPFTDLLPDELDCCATRWPRFRKKFGYELDDQTHETTDDGGGQRSSGLAGRTTVDEASAEMEEAVRRIKEAIAEKKRQQTDDSERRAEVEQAIKDADLDGALSEIFGVDMSSHADDPWDRPRPSSETIRLPAEPSQQGSPVDTWALTAEIIVGAGESGIEMSAIHTALAERGVSVDRATVHKWLKAMVAPNGPYLGRIEWRPDRPEGRNGRWYGIIVGDPDTNQ